MSDPLREALWLVWSYEHDAWWRPNACGYTPHLYEAGLYSEEKALEIEREANRYTKPGKLNERAIPLAAEMAKYAHLLAASPSPAPQPSDPCDSKMAQFLRDTTGQDWAAMSYGERGQYLGALRALRGSTAAGEAPDAKGH